MKSTDQMRSACPLNCTLEIIGDKWSLLVIREIMFFEKKTYSELLAMKEGIATNILRDRLKQLESSGLITFTGSQKRKKYQLTAMGLDLKPVLETIARFGMKHFVGSREYLEQQMIQHNADIQNKL